MRDALSRTLALAAAGSPPPPDGGVTVLPQPSGRDAGVIAFTAHNVVFADVEPDWVRVRVPAGDLSAPLTPAFLQALAERLGRRAQGTDLLAVAPGLPGPAASDGSQGPAGQVGPTGSREAAESRGPAGVRGPAGLVLVPAVGDDHPRVARARRYRDDLAVWAREGAIVMIGRGVAGRWEVAVEVEPEWRARGVGRSALVAARRLVPDGEPLWAQISPGNVASVRAFLAAGFVPVGAEALLVP